MELIIDAESAIYTHDVRLGDVHPRNTPVEEYANPVTSRSGSKRSSPWISIMFSRYWRPEVVTGYVYIPIIAPLAWGVGSADDIEGLG